MFKGFVSSKLSKDFYWSRCILDQSSIRNSWWRCSTDKAINWLNIPVTTKR